MFEEKVYTKTISLETEMEKLRSFIASDNSVLREPTGKVLDFFKREVIETIKKHNCDVSEEEENKITIKGEKSVDIQKIIQDVFDQAIEKAKSHVLQSHEVTKNVPFRTQEESTCSNRRHGMIFSNAQAARSNHRHGVIFTIL